MNEKERALVDLGIEALNLSLRDLGRPEIGESSDVLMVPPVVLDFPVVLVERAGVAPFTFLFAYDVNICVGP